MRKTFFCVVLTVTSFCMVVGQTPSGNGAIVQYHSFNSQLTEKSDTLHRKYYYNYDQDVEKDEMVLIKYASLDYAVALYVRNAAGDTVGSVEIPKYYSDRGSHLTYLFKPSDQGRYQFLLTSKDSIERGKYTLNLAFFNPSKNPYDDNWEFCQRIDYLIQHSATDFQFVTGEKVKEFNLTNTRTTDYYLVTPSACEINYFTADVYVCTLLDRINLEKCIQKLKEMDYEIKQCISPEWKATEKKIEEVSEINKSRFVKELDYKLYGRPADDHNEFHEKYNLRYSVRFLIEKDLVSGYDFKIILE